MPARSGPPAGPSAWTALTRGVLRGVVLVLALVFAVIAGSPQDRFTAVPGGDGPAVAEGSSVPGPTSHFVSMAMADPDDGFDEATRIVVPSFIVGRPITRNAAQVTASADSAAPMVPERPPRTI